ncbi:MAG: hypothetical protein OSB62_08630 [Alphaproteobacteria bacterium]|nr:hypothetical protein [Alphaproteobacteria bacterium]
MMSLILRHFCVNGRTLDLKYGQDHNAPDEDMDLSMADIRTFTVFSPLPKNAHMMNGERGRVELFLKDGTELVFELSLPMAKLLFKRIQGFLKEVCNVTPRWEQRL